MRRFGRRAIRESYGGVYTVVFVNRNTGNVEPVAEFYDDKREAQNTVDMLNVSIKRADSKFGEFKMSSFEGLRNMKESRRSKGRMLKESEYEGYPYRVRYIDWETDGEDVDLPDEVIVDVPEEIVANDGEEEYISDYLSDTYGFLHNGFMFDPLEDE